MHSDWAAASPFEGTTRIIVVGVLPRHEARHDLVLEFETRGAEIDPKGYAVAATFNSPLHDAHLRSEKASSLGLSWDVHVSLKPDPWVAGGDVTGVIHLRGSERNAEFHGTVFGQETCASVRLERQLRTRPQTAPVSTLPRVLRDFIEDPLGAELPDFCPAGCAWRGAGSCREFHVVDFGARPDSGEDCHAAVQAALDAAAAAGGGVVCFPAGRFDLSLDEKKPSWEIRASGITVRGAGSGPEGTLLVNHRRSDSPDPAKMWRANEFPGFFHAGKVPAHRLGGYGSRPGPVLTRVRPAPRNAWRLKVHDAFRLRVGEVLMLRQFEDGAGSLARSLIYPSTRLAPGYVGEGRSLFEQTLRVVALNDDWVTIDAPLRWELRDEWRPEINQIEMLHHVGIASLRLQSCWQGYWEHHRNAEHDNGWDHIRFDGVVDGWVTDIVHDSPTTAVSLLGCKNCTVSSNRIVGNPAHNGFVLAGASSDNLVERCHGGRQMHAFSLQGSCAGNVFTRCEADEPAGIDLHGSIAPANLFDCIRGCVNIGGGAIEHVPPRHGRGLVLWNWETGRYSPYLPWRPLHRAATGDDCAGFIAVGVRGKYGQKIHVLTPEGEPAEDGLHTAWGVVEALNRRVSPESLYEWQCSRRLAPLPP